MPLFCMFISDFDVCTSPLIQERCDVLTKNLLCESLNDKLEKRPGSLELVEKGVLKVRKDIIQCYLPVAYLNDAYRSFAVKVDPGVATLIRGGSILYPRVASTSPTIVHGVPDEQLSTSPSPPRALVSTPVAIKPRAHRRSLKDETVISRYGSLVFHNYCPSSAASSSSPSLGGKSNAPLGRLRKHRAREVQQAELLHLEDAAQIHKRLGEEICRFRRRPCTPVVEECKAVDAAQQLNTATVFQSVLFAQPAPQQCFVIASPASVLPQQQQAQFFQSAQHNIIGKL